LDAWESHFREKSRRRSTRVRLRSVVGWALAALALGAVVMGLLMLLDL
jgi:hypothetical protein